MMRLALIATMALCACGKSPKTGSVCTAGDLRCTANLYEVCADDGESFVPLLDCAVTDEVCVVGEGCLTCLPDSRSCDGFDVVRCTDGGDGYDYVATCDAAQGDICFGGRCINACELADDNRSYEGCEYWAVDLDNAVTNDQGPAAAQQFSVVLSNASPLMAEVTIEIFCTAEDAANPAVPCAEGEPYAVEGPFPLAPGGLRIVDLDPREVDGSTAPYLNDGEGTFRSRRAFRISSTAPLIAYQFNPLENVDVFSNDASLLLPTSALGSRYLVMSWPQTIAISDVPGENFGVNLRTFLTIVGTADDTNLEVTVTTDTIAGGGIPAARAGDTLDLTIDRYEVINLETGSFNADFSGSRVVSDNDKPVAVFAGSEASDVPFFDSIEFRLCCADHLEEQLFPETSFGTQFVAVKSPLRTYYVEQSGWDVALLQDEPEYWRILASHEDTSVSTNLPPPNHSFFLQRGQHVTFESERDFVVQASHPVVVAQFPASQQTTGIPSFDELNRRIPGGDPAYITIPPVQQWRSRYLFLVPNKYAYDFLLIAAPVDATVLYDGLPLPDVLPACEYEPIGELTDGDNVTEYMAIRCPLSAPTPGDPGLQDDGVHTLEEAGGAPIGLVVYGWDSFVSYGYPGGTNVNLINLE